MNGNALLDVKDLKTHFHTREGVVRAVDGVSFSVDAGETVGIVGESGSGKSVANLSMLGLIPAPPGRIEGGSALFEGRDLLACSAADLRAVRGKRISMVFQDPMTALNPYMRIGAQLAEPLIVHEGMSKREAKQHAVEALEAVGIHEAERRMAFFPHEFSGGMRQRVMIAMALITKPRLLIADEPTTALDVTIQAQVLDLLADMQRRLHMAVILITHDLGVIARSCTRVYVMYAGRIMESAATRDLFERPRHPYTEALMASLPSTHKKGEPLFSIPGLPPDLTAEMDGCPFAPRCPKAVDACRTGDPVPREVGEGHTSACFRVQGGEL